MKPNGDKSSSEHAPRQMQRSIGELPYRDPQTEGTFCNFCGRGKGEYSVLVDGPNVSICDECIERCSRIVAEKEKGI